MRPTSAPATSTPPATAQTIRAAGVPSSSTTCAAVAQAMIEKTTISLVPRPTRERISAIGKACREPRWRTSGAKIRRPSTIK
jgi:hypothetical protein